MSKQKEAEKWKALADAFFRFVQRNPPAGFNPFGLAVFGISGRTEDMIKLLDDWVPSEKVAEPEKKEGASHEG